MLEWKRKVKLLWFGQSGPDPVGSGRIRFNCAVYRSLRVPSAIICFFFLCAFKRHVRVARGRETHAYVIRIYLMLNSDILYRILFNMDLTRWESWSFWVLMLDFTGKRLMCDLHLFTMLPLSDLFNYIFNTSETSTFQCFINKYMYINAIFTPSK